MAKKIFCDANCADSYRADLRYGLIYGAYNLGAGFAMNHRPYSIATGVCPYCGAEVVKRRAPASYPAFFQGAPILLPWPQT